MRERKTWPAMILAVATGSLGFWLLAGGISEGRWWLRMRDWQLVPCRIEEHWVDSSSPSNGQPLLHHLRYSYSWGDQSFHGQRLSFLEEPTTPDAWQNVVEKFPSEGHGTCWIDPKDPTDAVLIAPTISDFNSLLEVFLRVLCGLPIAVLALFASFGVFSSFLARPPSGDSLSGEPVPSPRWSPPPRQRGKRLINAASNPWPRRAGRWLSAVLRGDVRPPGCTVWCHTSTPRPGSAIDLSWDCRSPFADGVTVRLTAREEVRPAGSEAGDLHIHSLTSQQISHDVRGRATVDLPITLPPAWQGERHQVSWAIEVETHTSDIDRLSRFPISVASPPRLHVTPTLCPADSTLAAANSFTLAIPIADVAPGEAIAGVVTWKLTRLPRHLELRLICRCSGGAGFEERVAASCRLEGPAAQGRSGFQLQHPGTPLSWEGTLMTCSWRLEAVADDHVFAVMGLTVVAAM